MEKAKSEQKSMKAIKNELKRIHRGGRRPKAAASLCVGRPTAAPLKLLIYCFFMVVVLTPALQSGTTPPTLWGHQAVSLFA